MLGLLSRVRRRNHRRHHEGDRLAAAFGPRLFAGVVRKKLGLTLDSEKSDGERVYRIVARKAAKRRQSRRPGRKAA